MPVGYRNMAVVQGLTIAILVTVLAFPSVRSQTDIFITPTEQRLRANLTKLVQFVIHPSAKPSMDLINYALVAGGQPKNQQERMMYLNLMKKIARNTPEFVKRFTTTTTLPGGIKSETLDEISIDAHVTSRAMQYVQKQKEDAANANTGPSAATTPAAISTGSGSHGAPIVPAASAGIQNNANQYQLDLTPQVGGSNQVAVQDLHQKEITPAADGTISLAEVFQFINNHNAQNQVDPQFFF